MADGPTYTKLSWEFYSTFHFDRPTNCALTTPDVIKFRLMGHELSLSINDFNVLLGFVDETDVTSAAYLNCACDYIKPFATDFIDI